MKQDTTFKLTKLAVILTPAINLLAVVLILMLLLWQTANILLLFFAGILLALALRDVSQWLQRWIPLPERVILTLVILMLFTAFGLFIWFLAPAIVRQTDAFFERLPQAIQYFSNEIRNFAFGRTIMEETPSTEDIFGSKEEMLKNTLGVFSTTIGALGGAGIILAVGLYLAYDPEPYVWGVVHLFPKERRDKVIRVLTILTYTLRRWVVGRFVDMVLTGFLLWLALWLLNVPLPLSLAVMGALLTFIPNLGPIIASIPAILLGLMESPMKAFYVGMAYFAVTTIEGMLIMPLITQRAVFLPPVLVLGAQLIMGGLLGFIGVAMATPLLAVIVVIIKILYIKETLGDDIEIKGENLEPVISKEEVV